MPDDKTLKSGQKSPHGAAQGGDRPRQKLSGAEILAKRKKAAELRERKRIKAERRAEQEKHEREKQQIRITRAGRRRRDHVRRVEQADARFEAHKSEFQAIFDWLKASYPQAFGRGIRPLAKGTTTLLLAEFPDRAKRDVLEMFMQWLQRTRSYNYALAKEGARYITLTGEDAGPVTEAQKAHAAATLRGLERAKVAKNVAPIVQAVAREIWRERALRELAEAELAKKKRA